MRGKRFSRSPFKIILGVDQTGAQQGAGAKPLPVALLCLDDQGGHLSTHLLERLDLACLEIFLHRFAPRNKSENVFVLVDSVFWPLGGRGQAGLLKNFREASRFQSQGNEFGRVVARDFFAQKLQTLVRTENGSAPSRLCERIVQANSVFRDTPYQKNIQTGTFRVWKDLGREDSEWTIWPFKTDKTQSRFYLAEGYPSHFWRTIFDQKKRNPWVLKRQIELKFLRKIKISPKSSNQIASNSDLADAAVLALGAYEVLQKCGLRLPARVPESLLENEGWIFGLDLEQALDKRRL